MVRRLRSAALAAALVAFAVPLWVRAAQVPATAPEGSLPAVLARLASDPAEPAAYHADVKLHVHLRIFPWISVTLHGNEAYKHPGIYHFVFRGVPKAAEHFSDMAYDLGNSSTWPEKYDISLVPETVPDADPVLRLVPRKHGMVKTLDVTVDRQKNHIVKAVWSRFDGGIITLVQHYDTIGTKEVVASQDAQIRIPRMKADLTATYENITLDTAASTVTK